MSRPELTTRQAQVVERVAQGMTDKRIAAELGISVRTVHRHIDNAASRIPGDSTPRYRLTRYGLLFLDVESRAS